jgi:hypothetical protein
VTEGEGATRSVLQPGGRSVGAKTHPRTEQSASKARGSHLRRTRSTEVRAQSRTSWPRGLEQDAIGADAGSSRDDQATREPQPGDRKRTRSRRTPRRVGGQPTRRWQTARRDHSTIGFGRRVSRSRSRSDPPRNTAGRYGRNEPLDPSSSQGEVGVKPDDRKIVEATNGRRGADRSDAERLPTRSKPSQGGSASEDSGPAPTDRKVWTSDPRENLANPHPVPAATCRKP